MYLGGTFGGDDDDFLLKNHVFLYITKLRKKKIKSFVIVYGSIENLALSGKKMEITPDFNTLNLALCGKKMEITPNFNTFLLPNSREILFLLEEIIHSHYLLHLSRIFIEF